MPATTAPGQAGRADLVVRVLDSAASIPDVEWRRLTAGRGLYSSLPWLRLVEADPWHDAWYVTVRDGSGVLRGVLPVYLPSGPSRAGVDAFYDPASVFLADQGGEVARRWRPTMLAGTRAGYETDLLVDPDLDPAGRRVVLDAMVTRWAKLAEAWGVDGRAAMYLLPDAARQLAPSMGAAPLLTDVTTAIPLDGMSSFDDYVASLPSRRRNRVRREVRDFAGSGLSLRWTRLSEVADAVAPLLAAHHGRYGHHDTPEMLTVHLRQQAVALDASSRVLLCERRGALLGVLLAYEWEDVWYARLAATGEGLRGHAFAFFSLVYYGPVAAAIERGIHSYVLGPSGVTAKVHRGARVETRWSLLAGSGECADDVRTLEQRWNPAATARWAEELSSIGIAGEEMALP